MVNHIIWILTLLILRNGYEKDAESSQGNKKHCAFCDEVVVCMQKDNKQGTTLNGVNGFMKSHLILIFQNLSQIFSCQIKEV